MPYQVCQQLFFGLLLEEVSGDASHEIGTVAAAVNALHRVSSSSDVLKEVLEAREGCLVQAAGFVEPPEQRRDQCTIRFRRSIDAFSVVNL